MKSGSNTKKFLVFEEQGIQTDSEHTQVTRSTLCVESEFMENVEECLDAMTPEKYMKN